MDGKVGPAAGEAVAAALERDCCELMGSGRRRDAAVWRGATDRLLASLGLGGDARRGERLRRHRYACIAWVCHLREDVAGRLVGVGVGVRVGWG